MSASVERSSTDWFAVFALFAAGLTGAMHFAKLAPVMTAVKAELALGPVGAGFAVSVLGIVGVIFAIAASALVNAIGLRRGLSLAMFGGAVLAFAGAAAPDRTLFLGSRLLEGFSHLLIVVACPALMAWHAAPKDRPIVLSLWGCFFGFGFAITSAVAPSIVEAAGWRGLLAAHGGVMGLVGLLCFFALQRSGYRDEARPLPGLVAIIGTHKAVYASGAPLKLALAFCAYTLMFLAFLTFLGPFLVAQNGMSEAAAGRWISLVSLVSLGFTLLAGLLARLGVSLFFGLAGSFLIAAVSGAAIFAGGINGLPLLAATVMIMAAFGLMPGFVFANVPVVAPGPAAAALTYGAIAQFGNVGTFAGTPMLAAMVEALGWQGAALFFAAICAAGTMLARSVMR